GDTDHQGKGELDGKRPPALGELDQLALPDGAREHHRWATGSASPVSFRKRSPRFGRRTRMLLTRSAVPFSTASTCAGLAPRARTIWTVSPSTFAASTEGSARRLSSSIGEFICNSTSLTPASS